MGIFDSSKAEQIKYLEDERKKLWDRVIKLEGQLKQVHFELNRKADSEASQSSKKAAEFRNKTEERLKEATELVVQLQQEFAFAKNINTQIQSEKSTIDVFRLDIQTIKEEFNALEEVYKDAHINLTGKIENLESFFNDYPELDVELAKISDFIQNLDENLKKSALSLQSINKRKSEIDNIHREIFGYEAKDNDEVTKIEGLKDELDNAYNNLKSSIEDSVETINKLDVDYKKKYEDYELEHNAAYQQIIAEIRSLLPNALTAGLSAAFSKKKEDEEKASIKLQANFRNGIYLLLGVSTIPFIAGIVFLLKGIAFEDVIMKLPRLVLAIIPMYIPVLWFTYSANKKLNLSKRLIEEYAHKEVLSKTYEGLTAQINNIEDKTQSEELRFRLLANFLQVSSENPGKLISNYEASDHPIMEALEQSYKFQVAIDKLEGIPGLGKVAALLEKKAKNKIEDKKIKTEEILEQKIVNKN